MGRASATLILIPVILSWALGACTSSETSATSAAAVSTTGGSSVLSLPPPRTDGGSSLNRCLAQRRSVRAYTSRPFDTETLGQLLWAAQGMTSEAGGRTAPSAGGRYPLEVYAVVGMGGERPAPGLYHYVPEQHGLEVLMADTDLRQPLSRAALDQKWVAQAPVVVVITAVPSRTTAVYGERGLQYVWLEAGHAAQNLLLQAVALGLGAVPVGAFQDEEVRRVLSLSKEETPLYLIPVGEPAPSKE